MSTFDIFHLPYRLCGSYESLKGGQTAEAMEDFTGGVNETFKCENLPDDFFKMLLKAQSHKSLMCCSINAKPNEIEAKLDNGLIKGHAYTITSVTRVSGNCCLMVARGAFTYHLLLKLQCKDLQIRKIVIYGIFYFFQYEL